MVAKVAAAAPDFRMLSTKDLDSLSEVVSLGAYRGRWLVLFFYPLDFTFVCPTEIRGFHLRKADFDALGAEVLGVSVDSVHAHRAWIKMSLAEGGLGGSLNFPLASDMTKQTARDYGVLLEEQGIALRGLFIIDPHGILRYAVVSDLNVGRSVEETLRVLHALQSGGLCPLDWQPGEATL